MKQNKITKLPIFSVFTKEYKEEVKYREFLEKNINVFKLKSYNGESVDTKVKRLIKKKKVN